MRRWILGLLALVALSGAAATTYGQSHSDIDYEIGMLREDLRRQENNRIEREWWRESRQRMDRQQDRWQDKWDREQQARRRERRRLSESQRSLTPWRMPNIDIRNPHDNPIRRAHGLPLKPPSPTRFDRYGLIVTPGRLSAPLAPLPPGYFVLPRTPATNPVKPLLTDEQRAVNKYDRIAGINIARGIVNKLVEKIDREKLHLFFPMIRRDSLGIINHPGTDPRKVTRCYAGLNELKRLEELDKSGKLRTPLAMEPGPRDGS